MSYTQLSINDAISAILAGKYAATYFQLQMDPTAWQEANFVLTEAATFNPFHQPDETVADLVTTIQTGSTEESDAATKELNAYVVDQAWFDPWYRVEGNFVADAKTDVVQQNDNAYPYLWNIKPKGSDALRPVPVHSRWKEFQWFDSSCGGSPPAQSWSWS